MEKKTLWEIPSFVGKASIDPKAAADYILSLPDVRADEDPNDTRYEDIILSDGPEDPLNPIVQELMNEVCNQLADITDATVKIDPPVWTIIHGRDHSTYPHNHMNDDRYYTFVYWVKVPAGGGNLNYYPLGLPYGPEKWIEPEEGSYIIFPGYLLHGVRRNTSNEPRISISTNLLLE